MRGSGQSVLEGERDEPRIDSYAIRGEPKRMGSLGSKLRLSHLPLPGGLYKAKRVVREKFGKDIRVRDETIVRPGTTMERHARLR